MKKIDYILVTIIAIAGFSGILYAQQVPVEEAQEAKQERIDRYTDYIDTTKSKHYKISTPTDVFFTDEYLFMIENINCIQIETKSIICGSFTIKENE